MVYFHIDLKKSYHEVEINIVFFFYFLKGKLFFNYKEIFPNNNKFFYSDILNKLISYKLDDKYADKDKIKFKITDGFFSIFNVYEIRRASPIKLLNDLKTTGKSLRLFRKNIFLNF
jgi:hypothetical protein